MLPGMQDLIDILTVFAPLWVPSTIISAALSIALLLWW